jgi:SET domain-containing protein
MLNPKIDKRNISKINRYGLFAREVILKDELIWSTTENHIKKISLTDFEKLSAEDKQIWIDHCYQIDDYFQMDVDDTRFMNHSCAPNTVDFPVDEFPCNCGNENCVGVVKKNATIKRIR